jgi:hypothetical protein
LREKLGLPTNKRIVVSIGAIIKRKRPKKLIEIFFDSLLLTIKKFCNQYVNK